MTTRKKYTIGAIALIVLFFGGRALFKAGQRDALQSQIRIVDAQLQATSAQRSPENHIKLLAKRKALQDALNRI